jgi:hypothetical protein
MIVAAIEPCQAERSLNGETMIKTPACSSSPSQVMAKAQKPASAGSKSQPSKQKATQPTEDLDNPDAEDTEMGTVDTDLSVAALKAATVKNREEYCKSSRTREAYQGQVKWGKEFLA